MTKPDLDDVIETTCEVVRARIVSELPHYAGCEGLAKAIERAATEFAGVGQRDPERLIQYAHFQARSYLCRVAFADYSRSQKAESRRNVEPSGVSRNSD